VRLFKFGNGGGDIATFESPTDLVAGKTYLLKVVTSGSKIIVFLDGEKVIETSDSTYLNGNFGLLVWNDIATFTEMEYENNVNFNSNLSGWTTVQGKWMDTGSGKAGSSSGDAKIISAETGSDFTYQASVISQNGKGAPGLIFRSNDDGSEAYVANIYPSEDTVSLFKFGNGGGEIAKVKTSFDLKANEQYKMKVVTSGENIKVYVNEELVIDANDSTYKSGKFGLLVWNDTAIFNDVNATNVNTNLTNWTLIQGVWSESLFGKVGTSSGDAIAIASEKAQDFVYEADIKIDGNKGGKGAGALMFRSNEDGSKSYVLNIDALNDVVTLFAFGAPLVERYKMDIKTDKIYHLKVVAKGTNLRVFLDDILVHNVTDSSYTEGHFGLLAWNASAQFNNIIVDKEPPTATVSYSITDPTNQNVVAAIRPSETVTVTNNGGSNQYTFEENGEFTFEFVDAAGNKGSVTAKVSNIDKVSPKLSVDLDQSIIKVPNHKMVKIQAQLKYSDDESGVQSVVLDSIKSNETDSGLDSGDKPNDIQNTDFGTEDTSFDLRAERSGAGTGRVYMISYTVIDKAGNRSTKTVTVTVQHDSGKTT
jgi:hypothetical protein